MAEPASSLREAAERLALAGIGAVALTAERADALAEELAARGGMTRAEVRETIEDATRRWRGEATRMSDRAAVGLQGVFHELGLVTREEVDELELRVAQLEHRLRLVEGTPTEPIGRRPSAQTL